MEPTAQVDPIEVFNLIAIVLFTLGSVVGSILTGLRWLRYIAAREEPPELLWRDLVARLALAIPFAGILLIRLLGANPREEWWGVAWYIGSAGFAVFGIWMYVYYEAFVIERHIDRRR